MDELSNEIDDLCQSISIINKKRFIQIEFEIKRLIADNCVNIDFIDNIAFSLCGFRNR